MKKNPTQVVLIQDLTDTIKGYSGFEYVKDAGSKEPSFTLPNALDSDYFIKPINLPDSPTLSDTSDKMRASQGTC